MKVVQLTPVISSADATGNDILNLYKILEQHDVETHIVSKHEKNVPDGIPIIKTLDDIELEEDDVVIFHFGIGNELVIPFTELDCKKVVCYHNITPPAFFKDNNRLLVLRCTEGLDQARFMADKVDYCIADSSFNKSNLEDMGYECPIDVVPIALPFEDYMQAPDERLLSKLRAKDGTKVLFVGRVAPNKRFEDVISAFSVFKRRYDPKATLYLVGSHEPDDLYYASLVKYVEDLGLQDVIFTGSVPFPQLLAYYRGADIFLCQSEHEGFCVPLVESMLFDLPIIAYDYCAVGETMGEGALALPTKTPEVVAAIMNKIQDDDAFRERIIASQRTRLDDFAFDSVSERFLESISRIKSL
ncbi:MAG: glycosyltransferase family 4 protein [Eggerthellaceae bacterium]|nr:glycosyltransferase family 4 protein [Eggerthellaceae bacterium]